MEEKGKEIGQGEIMLSAILAAASF